MPAYKLSDGNMLSYDESGAGETIVLLHGVWMSSRFFSHQLIDLGKRFHVIAIDFRGHGKSTATNSGHTVAHYAKDLHEFITGLSLRGITLLGWSMGALVSWEYQKRFGPERIRATIVVDQSASDFSWPDWPLGVVTFEALCRVMKRLQEERYQLAQDFLSWMFKNTISPCHASWMIADMMILSDSAAASIFFDQTVQDYRSFISSTSLPTLLCFGRDPKMMPPEAGDHLRTLIPGAALHIFESSGHCPFFEEPDRFNRLVLEFVHEVARKQ